MPNLEKQATALNRILNKQATTSENPKCGLRYNTLSRSAAAGLSGPVWDTCGGSEHARKIPHIQTLTGKARRFPALTGRRHGNVWEMAAATLCDAASSSFESESMYSLKLPLYDTSERWRHSSASAQRQCLVLPDMALHLPFFLFTELQSLVDVMVTPLRGD